MMLRQYSLVLALIFLTSCKQSISNQTTQPRETPSTPTRSIEHVMGETNIPVNPERVVALDDCTLEPMLALGVQPIGAPVHNVNIPGQHDLSQIQDIGAPPNLETILALKPDLILGCAYLRDVYHQTSKIAPTVIAPIETSGDWKAVFFLVADALGRNDAAKQFMVDYNARLATLRSQLGSRLNSTQVSVIRIYPDHIALYAKDVFIGTILEDAGLPRPPSQQQNVAAINISKERIQNADGDVIFVWTYGNNKQLAESAQIALEKLQADPLWQQLNAVKQGKVFTVSEYWIGAGPLSANAVIDDLFKYLLNQTHDAN